jgi:hypothetical protein
VPLSFWTKLVILTKEPVLQTSQQDMQASLTEAMHSLESFISKADQVSQALVDGVSPEALQAMCDSLLKDAELASQANNDLNTIAPSNPVLIELNKQRNELIQVARDKNQIINTVLAALIKQTSAQMQALKNAMTNAAGTYSAQGKQNTGAISRTLSKA